jgi:hypothetical protein
MAKNIPGTSSYAANVRCPTTGDAVNQAAWENGLTDVADRTAFLYSRRILSFASATLLKAHTGMSDGDFATLSSSGRVWQFRTGKPEVTLAADVWEPYGYAADDASGWWFHAPNLGSEMTVETKEATYERDTTAGTYHAITGTTDWVDLTDGVTPMLITFDEPCLESDRIEVLARFGSAGDGTYSGVYRAVVRYGGTDYAVPGSGCYQGGSTDVGTMICMGQYAMPQDATVQVKIQGKLSNALGTMTVGDTSVSLRAKIIRTMVTSA